MDVHQYGITRRDIRDGPGKDANEHFEELIGSTDFQIYRHPSNKIRGYESLKLFAEKYECVVLHITKGPTPVGLGYETIRITRKDDAIPTTVLKRAHNWAHRRSLLHLFQKERSKGTA